MMALFNYEYKKAYISVFLQRVCFSVWSPQLRIQIILSYRTHLESRTQWADFDSYFYVFNSFLAV